MNEKKRIQKILSEAGIASRRASETLIKEGRVFVNGKRSKLGDRAAAEDEIVVDGERVAIPDEKVYFALNKPLGYVVSKMKQGDAPTIYELNGVDSKLFSVGRLDKETEGLIFLTNDGMFAEAITHPKYNVEKVYEVLLDHPLNQADKKKIEGGLKLKDDKGVFYDAKNIVIESKSVQPKKVTVKIHIGKYHVVRNVFGSLGYTVVKLKRTQIGNFVLGRIKPGAVQKLSKEQALSIIAR